MRIAQLKLQYFGFVGGSADELSWAKRSDGWTKIQDKIQRRCWSGVERPAQS